MPSSFLDCCRFNPALGGTTDWTYSSAVAGYQAPAAAAVVNGATYSYRAESSDLSQWEVGFGTYNTSTGVLARTTVLFNSSGTTSKINFSTVPQIAIVALAEDLFSPARRTLPTIQVFTSGGGTYLTPANCLWIEVEMVGGGSSGAGSGTSGQTQNSGGNTTFATFTASGGVGRAGGAASGGSINMPGQNGFPAVGGTAANPPGGFGGGSAFYGGGGQGLNGGAAGEAAVANSGGGGGGGGGSSAVNTGTGGGAGGSVYAIINSPAASYAYSVGAGGAAGSAGASGFSGGAGAAGRITVIEHYGS